MANRAGSRDSAANVRGTRVASPLHCCFAGDRVRSRGDLYLGFRNNARGPEARARCGARSIDHSADRATDGPHDHRGAGPGAWLFCFRQVRPRAQAWPLHSHSAQWELYVIISGSGEVRTLSETIPVGIGDVFIHPPEEAHQLRNIGSDDLVYYVIADHALADVTHYPDSGKWFTKPQRKSFRMLEADYYDGEE